MNTSVSFELAKLVNSKGLPGIESFYKDKKQYDLNSNKYTIADVVCWICDNYQIWITAHPEYCNGGLEWIFNFQFLNDNERTWREQEAAHKIFFEDTYKSKEEAYEVCIKYVLNNLI